MSGSKTIAALTLGCKVNAYDTEAMLELFAGRGYKTVEFGELADIYLVNTCTVTNLGDKKSRQMLRRARRINPSATVVAAGCYAQVSPEEVLGIPEVDIAVGTKDRLKIVDIVENFRENSVTDIMAENIFEPLTVRRLSGHVRAYLKIQEGCDRYCSYCIIPYARGHIRSRPESEVLAEVQALVSGGYKEIVLAGIHVASYGADLAEGNLLSVISKAHTVEGLRRIRLSSVEPGIMSRGFLTALSKLPKVCPHFHLSLQSGCDRTLARMNRKYTSSQYMSAVSLVRELMPGAALTTDIIVGFPGETEADFNESLELARAAGFARIHVFPYSPKKGTPAAEFPEQLSAATKNLRAKKMQALARELAKNFLDAQLGKELEVLYETECAQGVYEGHSENYLTVKTASGRSLINEIYKARIVSREKDTLLSEPE